MLGRTGSWQAVLEQGGLLDEAGEACLTVPLAAPSGGGGEQQQSLLLVAGSATGGLAELGLPGQRARDALLGSNLCTFLRLKGKAGQSWLALGGQHVPSGA